MLKVKFLQTSYKKYLIWSVIRHVCYREVSSRRWYKLGPENDIHYREVSIIKYHFIEVLLWESDYHFILSWEVSVVERCLLKDVNYKETSTQNFAVVHFVISFPRKFNLLANLFLIKQIRNLSAANKDYKHSEQYPSLFIYLLFSGASWNHLTHRYILFLNEKSNGKQNLSFCFTYLCFL